MINLVCVVFFFHANISLLMEMFHSSYGQLLANKNKSGATKLFSEVVTLCNVMAQMVEEGPTLLRRMEICVAEAEKRSGKNAVSMQETFTVYLIETR